MLIEKVGKRGTSAYLVKETWAVLQAFQAEIKSQNRIHRSK